MTYFKISLVTMITVQRFKKKNSVFNSSKENNNDNNYKDNMPIISKSNVSSVQPISSLQIMARKKMDVGGPAMPFVGVSFCL